MTGATTTTTTKRTAVILTAGLFAVGLLLAIALTTGPGASADGHVTGGETIVLSQGSLGLRLRLHPGHRS